MGWSKEWMRQGLPGSSPAKSGTSISRFNFDDASVAADTRHRVPVAVGAIVPAGKRGVGGRAGCQGLRVRDTPDGIRWPLAGAGVPAC